MLGATALGIYLGHRVRHLSDSLKEPFGILQGALLGLVGLILAFGLSLAVSRYQDRRADIVTAANAIGTTYLRAQTLPEPVRSRSLALLVEFTQKRPARVRRGAGQRRGRCGRSVRGSRSSASSGASRRRPSTAAPTASAPRLYVETLNDMFDAETARVAALSNRVPTAVLVLEILGSAVALGLLAAYLVLLGRGRVAVVLASVLVAFLLIVTTDLDRPTRGLIRVPDKVLKDQLASMLLPPAAAPAPR